MSHTSVISRETNLRVYQTSPTVNRSSITQFSIYYEYFIMGVTLVEFATFFTDIIPSLRERSIVNVCLLFFLLSYVFSTAKTDMRVLTKTNVQHCVFSFYFLSHWRTRANLNKIHSSAKSTVGSVNTSAARKARQLLQNGAIYTLCSVTLTLNVPTFAS